MNTTHPVEDDPELIDTEAASRLLGVPPSTLCTWRSTGKHDLPFVQVGAKVRYRRSDLNTWLDARRQTIASPLAHIRETTPVIVRASELRAIFGISRSVAYDKIDPKSAYYDPSFPRPVKLTGAAIGWRYADLMRWVDSLHTREAA